MATDYPTINDVIGIDPEYGYDIHPVPANIKEQRCYKAAIAIAKYAKRHGGNHPTIIDLATEMKVSRSLIVYYTNRLRLFGLAVRVDRHLYLTGCNWSPPAWLPEANEETELASPA